MSKYSKDRIREVAQANGVSERTAYRWMLGGNVDYHANRRAEWLYLRTECAKNGTTRCARYSRKRSGYPAEAIAAPMKRKAASDA